ncbi:hypothetical protein K1719_020835 [Acacia pycnantha]|nr:hypothetical protein K1719_020835 [Acacia pycnantha]
MEGILPDGASINRPPGFNGEHYSFWKAKFKVYVLASEYGLWRVFEKGNYAPTKRGEGGIVVPKTEDEFNDADMKHISLNKKAIPMLQSALGQKEYFRYATFLPQKRCGQTLEIAYEGTYGIKENRINTRPPSLIYYK